MTRIVAGHFGSADEAERALEELDRAGFTKDDVSYVAHDRSGRFAGRSPGGISSGSGNDKRTPGGLMGLAPVAIPGLGPAVASGPIAFGLAGAATGGLTGALADMGVSEQQAKYWTERVAQGGSLIVVRAGADNVAQAEEILKERANQTRTQAEESATESADDSPDYGAEGSSQWSQRVLRVENDQTVIAGRTFSRDKRPKRVDEPPK